MCRLRVLLVSDIHCHYDNERALASWVQEHADAVADLDLIIASGDIAVMKPENNTDEAEVKKCEEDIAQVLESIELVRSLILAKEEQPTDDLLPIYWIPGNHDAVTTFTDRLPPMTEHSSNFHNAFVPIARGLLLCGFGGSVPGYRNGQQVWEGYPYTDNPSMEPALASLLPVDSSNETQLLLVTHVGPSSSATAVDQVDLEKAEITTGSSALDNLLRRPDMQSRVVVNVHGHTHRASGMARVGKVPVVNPGALLFAQFGLLELVQKDGRWALGDVRFVTL
mmetsp:Transcript_15823/g.61827  ORF Transcript_15823/g.61827 Transcript_15823/m.61827 type:complete len:281 (+) Transcript_15823:7-849(+)